MLPFLTPGIGILPSVYDPAALLDQVDLLLTVLAFLVNGCKGEQCPPLDSTAKSNPSIMQHASFCFSFEAFVCFSSFQALSTNKRWRTIEQHWSLLGSTTIQFALSSQPYRSTHDIWLNWFDPKSLKFNHEGVLEVWGHDHGMSWLIQMIQIDNYDILYYYDSNISWYVQNISCYYNTILW